MKKTVLVLCIGNCCRSPIAEGLWKKLGGDEWDVYSAGSNPAGFVHPLSIQCMEEVGIDATSFTSNAIRDLPIDHFDLIITLCDIAKSRFPVLPGDEILHWPLPDPYYISGSSGEQLDGFRSVRDELEEKIANYLADKEG